MFLTSPAFEYKRPFGEHTLDGQIWRGVEVFWDIGGFIARVRLREDPQGHERTLLLSRDADVAQLVDGPLRAELKSLTFLRAPGNGCPRFAAEDIREIYQGTDARINGGDVLVLRGASGNVIRVNEATTEVDSRLNLRLIARIGE